MERDNITLAEKLLRDFFAPLKRGSVLVYEKIVSVFRFFAEYKTLAEENRLLKEEISALKDRISLIEEHSIENASLREMLNLSEDIQEWQPVAVAVIGRSSEAWYNTITIKGGENRGFTKNMPVINTEGLIGRILSVSRYSAEVILITDKECAVGAVTQIDKTPGIVEGEGRGGQLSMLHIPNDAEITLNQVVITSGLGGVFPKGLRIGYITEINSADGDLMLKGAITPFVDFERLDNVFVLTYDYASEIGYEENGGLNPEEDGIGE
jgi:rod shape-determining protein MreC